MNREQFIIATAIILFLAFVLGWFASWLMHRLSRVTRADMGELERMAQALHEAEETRDQALVYFEDRERDLSHRLHQAEGEARGLMDTLRDVRDENEQLRAYIDKHQRG